MRRALPCCLLLALLVGCQLPPEQQVPPPEQVLAPFPLKGEPQSYTDLVVRARAQAETADSSFMKDQWADVESTARLLEKTAEVLGSAKLEGIPNRHRDKLAVEAGDLGKAAGELRKFAATHDVANANQTLGRIQFLVRQLSAND